MKKLTLALMVGGGLIVLALMVWQGQQQRSTLQTHMTSLGISDPVWLRQNAGVGGTPTTLFVLEDDEILSLTRGDIQTVEANMKMREDTVESSNVIVSLVDGRTLDLAFMGNGAKLALKKLKTAGLADSE